MGVGGSGREGSDWWLCELGYQGFYVPKKKKQNPHSFPVFDFYYYFALYSGDLAKNPEKYESLFIEDLVTCLSI